MCVRCSLCRSTREPRLLCRATGVSRQTSFWKARSPNLLSTLLPLLPTVEAFWLMCVCGYALVDCTTDRDFGNDRSYFSPDPKWFECMRSDWKWVEFDVFGDSFSMVWSYRMDHIVGLHEIFDNFFIRILIKLILCTRFLWETDFFPLNLFDELKIWYTNILR